MDAITAKFGGSSLADAAAVLNAKAIIDANPSRRFVVPSAPGKRSPDDRKITDLLYAWHTLAIQGLHTAEPEGLIRERYTGLLDGLGLDLPIGQWLDAIAAEASKHERPDFLASRGEYLNGRIIAALLDATFVDPASCVRFTKGGDLDPATYDAVASALSAPGRYVIPGFYGTDPDGDVRTFSRGGSDITGAIVARATDSALYENWTDVSGFRMTDPRIVPEARHIAEITYTELRELSYMGATVLHDDAVYPVRDRGIPIHLRNTRDPAHPGTRVVTSRAAKEPVAGVAGRKGFSMINIEKAFMNKERGFGRRILSVLEEYEVGWEHMPTGIDTISLILRDEELGEFGERIVEAMRVRCETDQISLTSGLAMIATVGLGMNRHIGIAAQLCTALADAGVNLRVIDQGSSEMNIIVGVEETDFERAVRAIYDAFATGPTP